MMSSEDDQNPMVPEPAVSIRYIRNAAPAVTRNAITDPPCLYPKTVYSTLPGENRSPEFRKLSPSELVMNTVTPP
jgi:hypothetical protein